MTVTLWNSLERVEQIFWPSLCPGTHTRWCRWCLSPLCEHVHLDIATEPFSHMTNAPTTELTEGVRKLKPRLSAKTSFGSNPEQHLEEVLAVMAFPSGRSGGSWTSHPRAPSLSAANITQSEPRPSAHEQLNLQRNHCFIALTARQFQRIATVTLSLAGGG